METITLKLPQVIGPIETTMEVYMAAMVEFLEMLQGEEK